MAFWRRILGRDRRSAATSDQIWMALFGGRETKSGRTVTVSTALECMTVLACVRVLANGVAQVPWKVFRPTDDGGALPARDHWAWPLLYRKPNAFQTSFEFRQTLMLHLALCFNAFAVKNFVGGRLVELIPVQPTYVTVRRARDLSLSYEIRPDDGGAPITVPADRMWHLRNLSWNGWQGMDAIGLVREAVGLGLAAEEHAAKTFRSGGRTAGILTPQAPLDQAGIERIKKLMTEAREQGGDYGAMLLPFGVTHEQLALSAIDTQLIDQRRFQIEEICRGYGVHPAMVGVTGATSSYASVEQFFLMHVVHTLMPLYELIQQSADISVIGDDAVYNKLIAAGLLRGDMKTRFQSYKDAILTGWMTRNEARALEEMNPLEGLDAPLRPLNMGDGTTAPADDPATEGARA